MPASQTAPWEPAPNWVVVRQLLKYRTRAAFRGEEEQRRARLVTELRTARLTGIIVVLAAFVPKLPALLQVVPDPVAGAYIFIFLVLLFRQGVRMVTTGGFSYEKGLVVCISFWVGLGFQNGVIFPDHLPAWSRGVLDNGMAAGGIVAMVLTLMVSLRQRGRHVVLEPSVRSLSTLKSALDDAAQGAGWDETATNRLQLAGKEAFLYLLERQSESEPRPIRVAVRLVDDLLQIEFVSGPNDAQPGGPPRPAGRGARDRQGCRTAHPSSRGEGGEARAVLRSRRADSSRGHPTARVRDGGPKKA